MSPNTEEDAVDPLTECPANSSTLGRRLRPVVSGRCSVLDTGVALVEGGLDDDL